MLGSRRVARPRGMDVAVFRNDQDQVFALLDRCPHKGGPLSQGIVFGTSVACPLHNWTIGLARRLRQGAGRRLHDQVRVQGGSRAGPAGPGGAGHPGARPGAAQGRPGRLRVHRRSRRRNLRRAGAASTGVHGLKETRSTCPYCGVGCGVIIESEGEQITGVRGDPDHPANFGRLCTKGSTLHLTASAPITRQTRLLHPMRREHRGEKARPRLAGTTRWTSPPRTSPRSSANTAPTRWASTSRASC